MIIRTYSELIKLPTLKERFQYLKLDGKIGVETFGFDRYINQMFYTSDEWLSLRNKIIIRDNGCDLGLEGYDIEGRILIHHMNTITTDDILTHSDFLLNPEYLISTRLSTHTAIHYSDKNLLIDIPMDRQPNDTCPWKHK